MVINYNLFAGIEHEFIYKDNISVRDVAVIDKGVLAICTDYNIYLLFRESHKVWNIFRIELTRETTCKTITATVGPVVYFANDSSIFHGKC